MMLRVLIVSISALCILGNAQAEYTVSKVRGAVTSDDKALGVGLKLADGSMISSSDAGAHVVLRGPVGEIALKGEFQFELPEDVHPKKGKEILARLLSGKIRVRVPKGSLKSQFRVRTPGAVAGVRGTDFFLSFLPLLGETEVICYESEISFADATGKSPVAVKTGQWGGHGGRFGSKIAAPLNLGANVLEHFGKELAF